MRILLLLTFLFAMGSCALQDDIYDWECEYTVANTTMNDTTTTVTIYDTREEKDDWCDFIYSLEGPDLFGLDCSCKRIPE